MNEEIFLDANAHIPLNPKALEKYIKFNKTLAAHGHPSSPSIPGRAASTAIEESREKIAQLIGAQRASQIIFTSSCTQACEWAAEIFFHANNRKNSNVLFSNIEHPAMRDAINKNYMSTIINPNNQLKKINLNKDASLDYDNLENYDKICWINLQNEIGNIYNLKKLKNKCKILLSDMSQSLGKIPVNVTESDVDIAVFGAHKFGGFGNLGFIYLKDNSLWKPFGTGSRYFMDRPGTMDVGTIVASTVALEDAIDSLPQRTENMISFKETLELGFRDLGYLIMGEGAERSPNTTFIKMNNSNALYLIKYLGDHLIHVGLGSACGSFHTGESPLMKNLGITGGSNDFVRFSQWGQYSKKHAKRILSVINNFHNSIKN